MTVLGAATGGLDGINRPWVRRARARAAMPPIVQSPILNRRAAMPVLVLIACFLAPTELSLYLGSLRLPPHRIALLVLLPAALWRMAKSPDIRLKSFDYLLGLYAAWTVIVYMIHLGQAEGLQFGGSQALESFASFVIARAYIRNAHDYRATLSALAVAVLVAGLIALPEALLGVHYVHDVLRELTGYVHPIGHETRLGLTRAYGTFDHPIHLGTFCASLLAAHWLMEPRRATRIYRSVTLVGATVLGLSSAPILCLGLQMAFIAWDRVTRHIPRRLTLTFCLLGVGYAMLSLVMTRSPIMFMATGMTLDSWTGFYRTLIWQHGVENVIDNPWIGIGLADWARPSWMASSTVDAYWLVVAMRTGIPALLLLVAAIVILLLGVLRRRRRTHDALERRAALGWAMSLLALSLVACTVHLWNVPHAYFFFFLGMAAWLAERPSARRR